MRIQAVCLLGLVVGLGGCSSADDSTPSSGGSGGSAGTSGGAAGNSQGGSGGFVNGGSGGTLNGGSGGVAAGGSGGAAAGGSGGAATGGASTGGAATGGAATGGASTGGATTGGAGGAATGGAATGGAATGGASTGGAATGGASTGGAATGGASTGGAAAGGASTGGASTGGASTGGTGGTTPTCTPVTITSTRPIAGNAIVAEINPELGTTDPDYLQLEFYSTSTGSVDLATVGDYATCTHCVLGVQDVNQSTAPTYYFQVSGTMNMSAVSTFASDGAISGTSGTVSGVTLTEVTIDPNTYVSTPVTGGKCLTLQTGSWSYSCNDGGTEYGAASDPNCTSCQNAELSNCCLFPANACSDNQDCLDLISCLNSCTAGDQTCIDSCANTYPNGISDFNDLSICMYGENGSSDVGACGTVCQ